MQNFKAELLDMKEYVEDVLKSYIDTKSEYQKDIVEAMNYSLLAGGKRLRPILVLKSCELVGGKKEEALSAAVSLEMIHTYSLIHDDLPAMDDDDLRRGKPTNHKIYGEALAILAGDGLLNKAYENLMEAIIKYNGNIGHVKAAKVISDCAGINGMIGGQVQDILSEGKKIDADKLSYIHKNKTSALIEAAILAGAFIGGANEDEIKKLKRYGECIGLCFQIRDDILDVEGDTQTLGKPVGSDDDNEKSTYITLYGMEKSKEMAVELYKEAMKSLKDFDKEEKRFFENLAKYLTYREN